MKRFLIGSAALLTAGSLAVAGFALLGPDGALAQETDSSNTATEYRFGPLDDVLDELVAEKMIDGGQADAIRQRMADKMPSMTNGGHSHVEGFLDGLPEGVTAPPGPPGTPEFDAWLDEMQALLGDDFFGGHMFRFDGEVPDDGFFRHGPGRMGPGMMGDGFHQFQGFGDFGTEDLQGFIDEMTDQFGGEFPEHMQDMLDQLQEQLSGVEGAETNFDA